MIRITLRDQPIGGVVLIIRRLSLIIGFGSDVANFIVSPTESFVGCGAIVIEPFVVFTNQTILLVVGERIDDAAISNLLQIAKTIVSAQFLFAVIIKIGKYQPIQGVVRKEKVVTVTIITVI